MPSVTNLAVVILLPLISQDCANDSTGILDHHLPSIDVPFAEESTTMNRRSKAPQGEKIRKFNWFIFGHQWNPKGFYGHLSLPVDSYCFFWDFLQVSESHCHGKLTAGGSPGRDATELSVLMWKLLNFTDKSEANWMTNLEDLSGNSSSSSSKGPNMSGSSLCCDARKLNMSNVAFLVKKIRENHLWCAS